MNVEELQKMQELTNKIIDDFKYMYNYNVDVVMETSEEKNKVSNLLRKITDLEIEKQELQDLNKTFVGSIITLGITNLFLVGALLLWLF